MLTFEHVPPRCVYNDDAARWYDFNSFERLVDGQPARYESMQRGTGFHSLCSDCNTYCSNQGYVEELRLLGRSIGRKWSEFMPPYEEHDATEGPSHFTGKAARMHPARIMRQVIAMFLAMSSEDAALAYPRLGQFVLDPEAQGLPYDARVWMTIIRGPVGRWVGLGGTEWNDHGRSYPYAELVTVPLSFTLVLGTKLPHLTFCEITSWADRGVDEAVAGEIQIPIGFSHTDVPGDFRTRAQIELDRASGGALPDHVQGYEIRPSGIAVPRDFGRLRNPEPIERAPAQN